VVGPDPGGAKAHAGEDLEDAVDLFDAGDLAQGRSALVEQGSAQQGDSGILARLDVDRAREHRATGDPQVHRPGHAEGDDLRVERLADPGQRLQAQVLLAALDPVDRTLAGAEKVGELRLRIAAVLASVADQLADAAEVVFRHGAPRYLIYVILQ